MNITSDGCNVMHNMTNTTHGNNIDNADAPLSMLVWAGFAIAVFSNFLDGSSIILKKQSLKRMQVSGDYRLKIYRPILIPGYK